MLQTDDILGIIPARMASTRFPGKPLVFIQDVPMVIRVYQEASRVLQNLVIASGDQEIGTIALRYGVEFILTRGDHMSGTSRCIEAMNTFSDKTGRTFGAILNIQSDEPMLTPAAIALLAHDISRPEHGISTLIRPETDPVAFRNPNRVKVVLNREGFALYFSRSPIPFYRTEGTSWFSHVGMYAFKKEILEEIGRLDPGKLEIAESLEQLRWLENGYPIHCCESDYSGFGIDTPEDLEALLKSGLI
ncbi:MAG: 3-deoxy-manno-octulosonate cytidylyltransferase [Porphyromonadaceae bacterium]|nr:MAG: 3-deoxy-manno-octulosonate cytidylyltransferase [Porphyromonadaceae bacterium]